MSKLADVIADLARNPVYWSLATAVSTDPANCVMTIRVGGVEIPNVPYFSSVAPPNGCEVHLLSSEALGLLVIGSTDRRSSVAGVVQVPGTAPPAPRVPPNPSTLTLHASGSDSLLHGARDVQYWAGVPDPVWADNGDDSFGGFWFYPAPSVTRGTVTGLTITATRRADVVALPPDDVVQPIFRLHGMGSVADGLSWDPTSDVWMGPAMRVGETRTISLPVGWGTALLAQTARGVAVIGGSRAGTMSAVRLSGASPPNGPSGDLVFTYLPAA